MATSTKGECLDRRKKTLRSVHLRMDNGERVESREWMAGGEGTSKGCASWKAREKETVRDPEGRPGTR